MTIPGTNEFYYVELDKKRNEISNIAKSLLEEVFPPYQDKDRILALNELIADCVCSELNIKYDKISSELFELERVIEREYKNREDTEEIEFTIPLFASALFGEEHWELKGIESNNKEYNMNLKSKASPITKEARDKTKEFVSSYMNSVSRVLQIPTMWDLLMRDLRSDVGNLELKVF